MTAVLERTEAQADYALVAAWVADIDRRLAENTRNFVVIGRRLGQIRDGKLYPKEYGESTFEDFCRDRWGWGRAYVYRLIAAAEVVANLSPIGDKLPNTESQARALSALNSAEQQRAAWTEALEIAAGGPVTARLVADVVERIQDEEEMPTAEASFQLDFDEGELEEVELQPDPKEERRQERSRRRAPKDLFDAADDDFDEAEREVRPGEWWQLGEHRLYCGDSASEEFVAQACLAKPQFAFADPPYNVGVADWDRDFTWRHDWLIEAAPTVIVTPGISAIFDFVRATRMPYRWSVACHIRNGMTRGPMGFGNWIYGAVFSTGSIYVCDQDVFQVSITAKDGDGERHKGRKPLEFLRCLIDHFSGEGDVVVDPFLGTGTTLIAAAQQQRRCIGAEINPEFCSRILARWERRTCERATKQGRCEVTNGNTLRTGEPSVLRQSSLLGEGTGLPPAFRH